MRRDVEYLWFMRTLCDGRMGLRGTQRANEIGQEAETFHCFWQQTRLGFTGSEVTNTAGR
jgi:hypothetical protein